MSEADVVSQLAMIYDRYWSMFEWWGSVTIGLLLVAHFAADRLTWLTLILLVGLYSLYTFWIYSMLNFNNGLIEGYFRDLISLQEAGLLRSKGASAHIEQIDSIGALTGVIVAVFLYLGSVVYLAYSFIRAKKDATKHEA